MDLQRKRKVLEFESISRLMKRVRINLGRG